MSEEVPKVRYMTITYHSHTERYKLVDGKAVGAPEIIAGAPDPPLPPTFLPDGRPAPGSIEIVNLPDPMAGVVDSESLPSFGQTHGGLNDPSTNPIRPPG